MDGLGENGRGWIEQLRSTIRFEEELMVVCGEQRGLERWTLVDDMIPILCFVCWKRLKINIFHIPLLLRMIARAVHLLIVIFTSDQTWAPSILLDTVWIKEVKYGWDKRQATLQVCVLADGVQRCKPQPIFHGATVGQTTRNRERQGYHIGVNVVFNKAAWANEGITL